MSAQLVIILLERCQPLLVYYFVHVLLCNRRFSHLKDSLNSKKHTE